MNIIEVNNLRKKYVKRVVGIKEFFISYLQQKEDLFTREFALKDISFSLKKGDSISIIGHNGAGKSTLLAILACFVYPDSGSCTIDGKIASLIDLGSGFHPDLNGYENIELFLSSNNVLKRDMPKRIKEINEFSQLGNVLKNRISTYSSGMLARLGFSSAIALYPDVLLIDEMIEVGDFSFKKKCFEYMQDFKKKGGSLVIVTHDLDKAKQLSNKGLVLHHGKVIFNGSISKAINTYYRIYGKI